MSDNLSKLRDGLIARNGNNVAETLRPEPLEKLKATWKNSSPRDIRDDVRHEIIVHQKLQSLLTEEEARGWGEVYLAYWKAAGEILAVNGERGPGVTGSWIKVYEAWKEFNSQVIRGYTNCDFEAYSIPCLYVAGKWLRIFAIKADEEKNSKDDVAVDNFQDDFDPESEKNKYLEDCARQLNRIFNTCLSDRASLEESRKWGIYYAINLLFKTYFRLNSASLSKNVLKALSAGRGDMPPLHAIPKAQQVTFKYYEGVLSFLEENYVEAEKHLTRAWTLCHRNSTRNLELILTYLIPCHLLTTHTLPSQNLLAPFPRLQKLFLPLSEAIRKGDLAAFDRALHDGEEEFVKRRIYLTLERGRDIALRNLLRKVFLAGGFDEPKEGDTGPAVRRTRIPVAEFEAAMRISGGGVIDTDEVECLMANMIYKNLMKGYIAHERGMVVLNKKGAFPGTGV